VQRQSDGSFVNPGESVLPCETLLVNSDVGFKPALGSQVFSAFVGVTAEMFVNGVSAGSVAPANLTTTRVGPAECADILDEPMTQFVYVIQAADAGTSILFRMDFAGKASLGGTCGLNVTGSPEISVDIVSCDDGDPCTTDTCDVVAGCINTPIDCNDNDACTEDSCVAGVCVNTPIVCDDGNACTTDECVDGVCVYTAIVCDDGNACTTDECVDGVCVYTAIVCNDNDACTTDECVDGVCVYTPIVCNDNNACTDDTCVAGVCVYTDNGTCGRNGCTPGFWKNCTANWCDAYATTDLVSSVFTVPDCVNTTTLNLGNKTLLQALSFQGGSTLNGGAQILLRAGTAALLNACKGIGYPLTTDQVIAQVNAALASCDRATMIALAGILDANNNLGCRDASGASLPCKPKL
jgi:hypothetical protein